MRLPIQMQRAMAAEAESAREAKAKVCLLCRVFYPQFSAWVGRSFLVVMTPCRSVLCLNRQFPVAELRVVLCHIVVDW